MSQKTTEVREGFIAALANVNTMDELEKLRVEYIGKKGLVTDLMKAMKDIPGEEKKAFGQAVNALKGEVEAAITEKREEV